MRMIPPGGIHPPGTPPRGPRIRGVTSGEIFTLAGSDLFFRSIEVLAFFFSVGPQAIAKYLKYFAFSRIGEAGGRAARDGVGGPLTFFFSS